MFSIWNRVLSKRQKILLAGLVDVSDVWMDVVVRNPKILSMPSAEDVTAIVDALLRQGECTEKEAMGGYVLGCLDPKYPPQTSNSNEQISNHLSDLLCKYFDFLVLPSFSARCGKQ